MRVRLKTLALWTAYTCALLVAVANVLDIRQAIGLDCASSSSKRIRGIEPWKPSPEARLAAGTNVIGARASQDAGGVDAPGGEALEAVGKQKKTRSSTLERSEPRTLRTQVFILTTWRSGSSFVGELFNQHPGVFYLFEPLWHVWQALYPGDARVLQGASRDMLNSLFRCDLQVFNLYGNGQNMTSRDIFRSPLNRALCSPPLCPALARPRGGAAPALVDERACSRLCPPRPLADVEARCRRLPLVVIKGVRIFDLELLAPLLQDPSLNLKVIHLVRDPRAVASSRLKSKHGLIRESLQVVRSLRRDKAHHHLLLQRSHRPLGSPDDADPAPPPPASSGRERRAPGGPSHPSELNALAAMGPICASTERAVGAALASPPWLRGRYMLVRYEDVVRSPLRSLGAMHAFAGLRPEPALGDFVRRMVGGGGGGNRSSAAGGGDPFRVGSMDARAALGEWRTRLAVQQVRQVEDNCRGAMALLGYIPVPAGARSLGQPLLAPLDFTYA
ncbi:carbohydrate sulfotransferase 2-like [Petromyzon marinus]|uniref:Carbohydrate sulfotransferase 2-like n=1 Tax=Petromyzon marinus TaxID=7757 RepID=A0AAJ7U896_PETMA|nr:carbohydrate sulfotransferase 2-like [Petromyzon marinus]